MLACGHHKEPFGVPVCSHLRECRETSVSYFRSFTGAGMDTELVCKPCAAERQNGTIVPGESVCKECFEFITMEIGDLEGVQGKPEIRIRPEPFDLQQVTTDLQ